MPIKDLARTCRASVRAFGDMSHSLSGWPGRTEPPPENDAALVELERELIQERHPRLAWSRTGMRADRWPAVSRRRLDRAAG
jgi:hypothetical protein